MADTVITFSISTNFPNRTVNPSRLQNEIRASSIVTALDFVNTSGDSCFVNFKAPLSVPDTTTLNAIIAAHTGLAFPPGAVPVVVDTNPQSVLFNQTVTANGTLGPFGNYSSKSVSLVINIKNAPAPTSSITFGLAEVDPGDQITVVGGTGVNGTAMTAAGTQVITQPASVSGLFMVRWVVTGTNPSFTGVFATLIGK